MAVKPAGMCCTTSSGTGSGRTRPWTKPASACGPPVEQPRPIARNPRSGSIAGASRGGAAGRGAAPPPMRAQPFTLASTSARKAGSLRPPPAAPGFGI